MKQEMLDVLVNERMEALEDIVNADEEYRTVRKEQMEASENLERMGLSRDQREMIDDLISRVNQSGAAYGKLAFKQGFKDGARFMSELKEDI